MVEIWPAIYTSSLEPVYPITSRKILRQEFSFTDVSVKAVLYLLVPLHQ